MIRIVQVGIGPLGRKITEHIAGRTNMAVVAAVDRDPELAGRDLGELCAAVSHPEASDLIFHAELPAAEVVRRALAHEPTRLPERPS